MSDSPTPAGSEFRRPTDNNRGPEPWPAEASTSGGKLKFHFDKDPSLGIVVTVESAPGAQYSLPEIQRLHAALGKVLAQLD